MSTVTSQGLPAGTRHTDPAALEAVRELSRTPKAFGITWLITVAEYANRTDVNRHSQRHHGWEARLNAMDEPRYTDPAVLLHWHLAAASPEFDEASLAELRALER